MEPMEIKPNKRVFIRWNFIMGSIFLLIFFLVLGTVFSLIYTPYFPLIIAGLLVLFILLSALRYYWLKVRYDKERYILKDNKIITKGGGIFSDYETELSIKNITNVTMLLPWFEHWRFNTGNILIDSAGGGGTECFMSSIDEPEKVYDYVFRIMKEYGFNLDIQQPVQEESPHTLGILFDIGGKTIAGLFFILMIGIGSIAPSIAFLKQYALLVLLGFLILFGLGIIWAVISYLDLKNRRYLIYPGAVVYEEGFLNKAYAYLPIENLADSSSHQTLIDRIFGLYDVKISCQGSGQEINFKNMPNGKKLEENLDNLISSASPLPQKEEKTQESKGEQTTKVSSKSKIERDKSYKDEFKINAKRALFPYFILCVVLFPLIPIWLVIMLIQWIQLSAITYNVKQDGMEEKFSLFQSKSKEFSNDKITAIIYKENLIDKWFNTFSIQFWSIGSSEDLTFRYINKKEGLVDNINAKSGIRRQQPIYEANPDFSFGSMFTGNLFLNIFGILLLIVSVVGGIFLPFIFAVPVLLLLIYAGVIIYKNVYYGRCKLTFYRDFISYHKGILSKQHYYVLYDNVKDITTTKYPFKNSGSLRFDIAGEHVEGQGNQKAIVSNHINIHYINDIDIKDELIDLVLSNRPDAEEIKRIESNISNYKSKQLLFTKPSAKNSIVPLLIISIIIFPFILLLPVTIPITLIQIRAKSYKIESYRVVARWGVIYKKQKSITFTKMDHLETSQGMSNKMFKNGNVTINTTGSSMPELIISSIPDYTKFYELLNRNY